MKKTMGVLLAAVLSMAALTGCNSNSKDGITVISREEGSGTRGAFVELMKIEADGVDMTTDTAETLQSTSVVITTVAGNKSSIGYISLGSLNDTVKAVTVDGVKASVENVKSGEYKVSRPFCIAYKDGLSEVAADFVSYIMSKEGQAIVDEKGYIAVDESAASYTPSAISGKITLAGSTSVAPVMEVIADEYKKLNSGVTIEIQQTGSGAGITSAIEDVCDIAMSSRNLKDEEIAKGLKPTVMALDGIAVIVNKENAQSNLTSEQIKSVFIGETVNWSELAK